MSTKKRIIAALCALVALAAISAAIKLVILKEDEPTPEHREAVAPPKEGAPDWVTNGQKTKPDYSAADMSAKNATEVVEEEPERTPEPTAKDTPKVVKEDEVFTFAFVDSLARYVTKRFEPGRDGKAPRTTTSFRSLNTYYSRNFDGIEVEQNDVKESRNRIIDYAFTPASIKALYSLYADLFVEQLADSTSQQINNDERTLTRDEMSDLFRLNAGVLSRTASIFSAIADNPDLSKLTAQYIQAVRAVERANVRFQESLTSSISKQEKSETGATLKQTITERERVRSRIIATIKKQCRKCPDDEMFYIALWAYRRTLGNPKQLPAFAAASESLQDLSKRFEKKADELLQPLQ